MLRIALVFLLLIAALPVRAETHATCTGFIDAIPATISTQGTWCLRQDVSTAVTGGSGILVLANNVTIDCNGFKLGGLAAGPSSTTFGIYAANRQNITVRRCSLRGFYKGISLWGDAGGGHLVEDNRLDNSLYYGIEVLGEHNRVQNNRVFDTGGAPELMSPYGINSTGDVIGNTVAGMFTDTADGTPVGIRNLGQGSVVRDNIVRDVVQTGGGVAVAIHAFGNGAKLVDNAVSSPGEANGYGIYASGVRAICTRNTADNFQAPFFGCTQLDNVSTP